MDNKVIALIDALISDKLESLPKARTRKGLKGNPGEDGKNFVFAEHALAISDIVENTISSSYDKLKLKFEDLTVEEKESLRGESGKSFVFADHENEIKSYLDSIKLKFEDLTAEDKEQLKGERGPRGQRGKPGPEALPPEKLTFDDFSEAEKLSLKGQKGDSGIQGEQGLQGEIGDRGMRGLRGYRGKNGVDAPIFLSGNGVPSSDGLDEQLYLDVSTGEVYLWKDSWITSGNIKGKQGERGIPGTPGLSVKGRNGISGKDGEDAPRIIDVEVSKKGKEKLSFVFYFSDGSKIETDSITLPTSHAIMQSIGSGGSTLRVKDGGVDVGAVNTLNFIGAGVELDSILTRQANITVGQLADTFTAGEDIVAFQAVITDVDKKAFIGTNDSTYEDAKVIGIALNDALLDESVNVLLFGIYDSDSFVFTLNNPFFLGTGGALVQTPPSGIGEFVVEVGEQIAADVIFMKVSRPVEIIS